MTKGFISKEVVIMVSFFAIGSLNSGINLLSFIEHNLGEISLVNLESAFSFVQ